MFKRVTADDIPGRRAVQSPTGASQVLFFI
jgi:hypothetical protein